MVITSLEKEEQHTLKGSRLSFLTQAGLALANNQDHTAIEFIWNYRATIPKDHDATRELNESWDKTKQEATHRYGSEAKKYQGDYLGQQDFTEKVVPEIEHDATRRYLDACWEVALKYQLIPSE